MAELILAHGIEHGLNPFVVLFLMLTVMGVGFAWLIRQPGPEQRKREAQEPREETSAAPRTPRDEGEAPRKPPRVKV